MTKLIGYARVSTRQQSTDRQGADFLGAGVRSDDLDIHRGVSGTRWSHPHFDRALEAPHEGAVRRQALALGKNDFNATRSRNAYTLRMEKLTPGSDENDR